MFSEDFAFAWQIRREWDDFYDVEVVHCDMYKTLFFTYKGRYYQFESVGYLRGKIAYGRMIKPHSYIFISADSRPGLVEAYAHAQCYDSFKDAVDHVEIVPGKKLRDLWDDPDVDLRDFS